MSIISRVPRERSTIGNLGHTGFATAITLLLGILLSSTSKTASDVLTTPAGPLHPLFEDKIDGAELWNEEIHTNAIVREGRHSGATCLRVTPEQGQITLGGVGIPIREHPRPGEYRHITFAWRKEGGGRIGLQVEHADESKGKRQRGRLHGYRFDVGEGPAIGGLALRLLDEAPIRWWSLTRDLWHDFGDFTLTGLTFVCPDGEAAWFDRIYLARAHADFQRLSEQLPGSRNQNPIALATTSALASVKHLPRGLLLRDGTLLEGEILAANIATIRYRDVEGGDNVLATVNVSVLLLQPVPDTGKDLLGGHRRGLLLANGDFLEGELVSLQQGKLTVSSVLFGLKQFEVANESMALVLDGSVVLPSPP